MSYQERKALVNILGGLLVTGFYVLYVLQKAQAGNIDLAQDLAFWGRTLLIVIGVGVVFMIAIQVLFHLVNTMVTKREEDPTFEDELDKLIELKAARIAHVMVGIGFVLSLVTLVMKMPPAVMVNLIYVSAMLGEMVSEAAKIHFYRRGI